MGVKLFAWIGGLALFLGVAFFIKYSFERNLVSPELRVAIGFVTGLGLLVGGNLMVRRDYPALSQTLCATGILILYAATFAARALYHLAFFGIVPTFVLMAAITTGAFLLSVRMNALVVAILGMLGGFLTPLLLATGQDNVLGLFGYIGILNIGLLLVAMHRRWHFLVSLAALCTALLQCLWAGEFFIKERYFEGAKILIPMSVLAGFVALYLAAMAWARARSRGSSWLTGSTLGLAAIALGFTAWFISFETLAQRPWLIMSFVLLIDIGVLAASLLDRKFAQAEALAGLVVFGLLALWTVRWLNNDLLNAALAFYLFAAVLHSVLPEILRRKHRFPGTAWAGVVFPPMALALVLIPILKLTELSFAVWPFVLLMDALVIVLAAFTSIILPVLLVLGLTLAAIGASIFKMPADLSGMPVLLFLIGAFSVLFAAVGTWFMRRLNANHLPRNLTLREDLSAPANMAAQLPILSGILPFLLLIMAVLRLPLSNPSPVFGLALLMDVLLLGLASVFSNRGLPLMALAATVALECAWHFNRFDPARAAVPACWYVLFLGIFLVHPFLFLKRFKDSVLPWAAAAMAGPAQFLLLHRLVTEAYPNNMMGLLPAVFSAPPLLALLIVTRKIEPGATRLAQLAWWGGTALFFITLIFPIQFERQWITLGWALEGMALLWLFHRVPHPGLRAVGTGLLVAAFVRLALNPAVLSYHLRSETPILNWYLYAYGVTTACLFCGARLLAPPRNRIGFVNAPAILSALGFVLAFLLLNIEIADYFSEPGSTLTFRFNGNFARDMTYSIAWALYALMLLVMGIARRAAALRYSALGLLVVTLIKLFLHDLDRLGQLYRIGALVGVAVIVMLASFAYQRYFTAMKRGEEERCND